MQHRPKIRGSRDQRGLVRRSGSSIQHKGSPHGGDWRSRWRNPGGWEGIMNSVKRVLLGSAAGVFAVAGAQAADLPVKAKPVEYVKVCSLYGAGFWFVPGTDTCIKVGAYTKLDVNYNASGIGAWIGGGGGGSLD